jgi:hypothetical protein
MLALAFTSGTRRGCRAYNLECEAYWSALLKKHVCEAVYFYIKS